MKKQKHYCSTKFSQPVIVDAWNLFLTLIDEKQKQKVSASYEVRFNDEMWQHDTEAEFFADYNKEPRQASYYKSFYGLDTTLNLHYENSCTTVSITAPQRSTVEAIHQVFAKHAQACFVPGKQSHSSIKPIIFIGHGRDLQWRDLKDHLQDKHGYRIEAYEVGARAGHTIRDILDDMLSKSSFAVIVMTAEDVDDEGNLHARENVIHELGLFQGKLGFSRAIILLEESTNEFSNIHGIHQVRFSKGRIKETFGEVLATLKREFNKDED
ncbi:MAG: nucleotide-binding protein [Nitrospirae bacterium]|nr:nucleotide-binding protein [Nitrospirota bacterium]